MAEERRWGWWTRCCLCCRSVFPHKEYSGATLEARAEMGERRLKGMRGIPARGDGRGGCLSTLSREASGGVYGSGVELYFLCGRDAAERIVHWDYGAGEGIREQLETFSLLVASRGGDYEASAEIRDRVRLIGLPGGLDGVSSSEVRRRIRCGEEWEDLAPGGVVRVIGERGLFSGINT